LVVSFIRELREVWRRQHLNWRTVVTRAVFNRFFNQMVTQYSNIYIRALGASPIELGAVNSASGLGSTMVSLPLGYMQDRYSVRKLYLVGVALATFVPLLYALAFRWEFIAVAILLSGLTARLASCVIICDLSLPNEDRATGKALCEGIGALPGLLAPTAAAIIITWFGGLTAEGIRPLFWIQFVVQVILFLFVALKLSEVERPKLESKRFDPVGDFREVFRRGSSTKRWLLFLSLNMFSSGLMVPYRYPYANEIKGANQFIIGGIATATVLTEAIFATPMGRMADRIGRKKLFFMLLPLSCLSNIIYILAPSPEWLLLAGFLAGFRMVAMFSYGSMTPELVPRDCIGRWRGLIGLCTGLVSIPAPIIGGLIWENLGPEWVFIFPIIIDLFMRVPLLYSVPETLHNSRMDNIPETA
jgi:MFS family permease